MKLPGDIGKLDFSDWAYSLCAAFIAGGAGAVVSGLTVSLSDPQHFSTGSWEFYKLVGNVFAISGLLNAVSFLRTKPLPVVRTKETVVRTVEQDSMPPKTVTTTKETVTEALNKTDK